MSRRAVIAAVPALLVGITWIDGRAENAWLPAILTALFWAALFSVASRRLKRLMVIGLLAATLGEAIFSLGLGTYTYRQSQIPLYVPPGHTILYAAVFIFSRLPSVRRSQRWLTPLLYGLGALYSVALWQRAADVWGFVCFGIFSALMLAVRGSRLFFCAMYLLVAWLELSGTSAGAWTWPATVLGRAHGWSSANPPSGVAVFYCLFDLSCLGLYFGLRFDVFERWVQRLVHRRQPPDRATG